MSCVFRPPVRRENSTVLNINQVTEQTQGFRNTSEQQACLCVAFSRTPKLSELQLHTPSHSSLCHDLQTSRFPLFYILHVKYAVFILHVIITFGL